MAESRERPMFGNVRSALEIARELSATIGTEFFGTMVKHLASALGADCVFIGEFVGGRVERAATLAAWTDGKADSFQYELAGSASAQIAIGNPLVCREGAQEQFPSDEVLARLSAQALVGIPLKGPDYRPSGVLMAVYRKPVSSLRIQRSLLEAFAPRAAAELERKREEDRLRESEQRYRVFVALNEDGMWRIEFDQPIPIDLPEDEQLERIFQYGYVAECNDALARIFGLERADQLTGRRVGESPPLANPTIRAATLHAIRSGYRFTTVETSPLDQDGKHRHMLRSQLGIVENGMLQRIWGTTRDITEREDAKLALDASERRMANLLETLQLVTVVLTTDWTVAYCNEQLYRLTGWGSSDVVGRNWFNLMPQEERSRAEASLSASWLQSDVPIHYEGTLLGPQGRRWWIAWDSTTLREAEGQTAVVGMVGRDLTGYKALEAQFRQAQKLESIGRLAGGVVHDFSNLLTVVMGYAGMLLQNSDPSDPAHAGLVQILKAAEKGADLTRPLLAFSRRQVLRLEPLNLTALIADAERIIRRLVGEDIKVVADLDPSLALVRADAGQIHQVLLNLVVNARDAMHRGGVLTISTSNEDVNVRDANVAGIAPGQYVQLTVADTGTGIPEEVRKHIFEPFYTTKEEGKGTGLGLSTVYGIVQQNGGHIAVETELGKGTVFRIRLPVLGPERVPAKEPGAEEAMPRGTETILLVEDEEAVRVVSASVLRSRGYNVIETADPEKAREAALPGNGSIDLLITDVVLPGTPGIELADALKASRAGMKVLFISGYAEVQSIQQRTLEPGFGYLQKPFAPAVLARKVREILDQY